jgi:hypothetical protein
MGRLTYTVHLNSLSGEQLGTYCHPGPDEPKLGTLLNSDGGLEGGPWRVSDYVQTDDSAPAKNVLVVEQIDPLSARAHSPPPVRP